MVAARIPGYMQGSSVTDCSDYYLDQSLEAAFYRQFE